MASIGEALGHIGQANLEDADVKVGRWWQEGSDIMG